ncbi:MAG: hypothetical protein AABX95_02790 [Nanoarchaeota archaeon]
METKEVKINLNQIMVKLARLQSDVDYLKIKFSLEEEMENLEQMSVEDSADFFEKHRL